MINITKSTPPPICLKKEKEKAKAKGDYKCGDVLERLQKDFFNKCYICETKSPTAINVEHFIPHRGDKYLKFDWNNLFFACVHCNSTKHDRYENILNCTNPKHDVLNWIKYELKNTLKIEVEISPNKNDPLVQNTVQLLNDVYNGTTTLKKLEATNLRKQLLNEYLDFQEQLFNFYKADTTEAKATFQKTITGHLAKSSPFTAFKRWLIMENPVFRKDFENAFD